MTRILLLAALTTLSIGHGHCETLTKTPAFEVASITPCKPGTQASPDEHAGMVQLTLPGGRLRASCITLQYLLEWAYNIQPFQHSGGPSWMDTDRYDVAAKAEGNATDEQMRPMLQTLLADRFQLKMHHEAKDVPVYVISIGKTAPRLVPSKDGDTRALRFAPQTGPDQKTVTYRIVGTRFTLSQVSELFARQLGRVIVDKTGLQGDFNFTLELAPDETHPGMDPSLLVSAMREQLGLALKSDKLPVPFLTIDSAEKVTAGN